VEIEPAHPVLATYLKLKDLDGGGPRDNANYNIARHFAEAINFIEAAMQAGGAVLVHCR
jgi:protein-tyrosine phosphatase